MIASSRVRLLSLLALLTHACSYRPMNGDGGAGGDDAQTDARRDAREGAVGDDGGPHDGPTVPDSPPFDVMQGDDGAVRADAGPVGDTAREDDGGASGDGGDGGAGDDGAVRADAGPFTGPGCVAGAREECDGLDNDCDGHTDEGCPCVPGAMQRCYGGPPAQAGRGVCVYGMQRCIGDGEIGSWGVCEGDGSPRASTCSGVDDQCNGLIDVGCTCTPGDARSCYSGPMGTQGVGLCRAGTQRCLAGSMGSSWGPCEGQVLPEPTRCDGLDRACVGDPSRGCACTLGDTRSCYSGPMGTQGVGLCRAGSQRCVLDAALSPTWGPCTGEVLPEANRCDGLDRLCNGRPRTDCGCAAGSTMACYTGPAATRSVGRCRDGARACVSAPDGTSAYAGACEGEVLPAASEVCGNGVDDDCDGATDEDCGCAVGSMQRCYSGPEGSSGVGICRAGTQTCARGADGVARFGACMGEVLPAAGGELCGNALDDDCDGAADDGCSCRPGVDTRSCYTGAASTRMVGACRDGVNRCVAMGSGSGSGMTGFESACTGQVLPSLELCNNHVDDDCDGMVDEMCVDTCITAGETPWQVLRMPSIVRYGTAFAECGYSNEFNVYLPSDRIPRVDDPAWFPVRSPQIDFGTLATDPDRRSPLTAAPECACGAGNQPRCGSYTLFQTYFNVPANPITGNADVRDFFIRFRRANNAVRVTIYNSGTAGTGINFNRFYVTSPVCDGATVSGEIRGETTVFRPGLNRLVLTLLDDCPGERELTGVEVFLNGSLVNPCR